MRHIIKENRGRLPREDKPVRPRNQKKETHTTPNSPDGARNTCLAALYPSVAWVSRAALEPHPEARAAVKAVLRIEHASAASPWLAQPMLCVVEGRCYQFFSGFGGKQFHDGDRLPVLIVRECCVEVIRQAAWGEVARLIALQLARGSYPELRAVIDAMPQACQNALLGGRPSDRQLAGALGVDPHRLRHPEGAR